MKSISIKQIDDEIEKTSIGEFGSVTFGVNMTLKRWREDIGARNQERDEIIDQWAKETLAEYVNIDPNGKEELLIDGIDQKWKIDNLKKRLR